MTLAAQLGFPGAAPVSPRIKQLGLTATSWLIAANFLTGGPLLAFWVGSRVEPSGASSMTGIVVALLTLAVVNYGLVALLWRLEDFQEPVGGASASGGGPSWLYRPRARRRELRAVEAVPATLVAPAPRERTREALVLIDGGPGGARPWRDVIPHLGFGFEVLTAVLPKSASIDTTLRAMDRAGWPTAHIVARPCDADVAVELARLGRASSLCLLDTDAVADDPTAAATAITEAVAFRRSR